MPDRNHRACRASDRARRGLDRHDQAVLIGVVLNPDHVQPGQVDEQVAPVAVVVTSGSVAGRRLIHVEVLGVQDEVEVL